MKKATIKKLSLNKETIKKLTEGEIDGVAGGQAKGGGSTTFAYLLSTCAGKSNCYYCAS
jgi:hypothetical protein